MPAAAEPDVIGAPLAFAEAFFQATVAHDADKVESGQGWGLREAIEGAVLRAGGLERVPALDTTPLEQLRPGTLVRFQGMVKDMWDPEFYMGVYEEIDQATGKRCVRPLSARARARPPLLCARAHALPADPRSARPRAPPPPPIAQYTQVGQVL